MTTQSMPQELWFPSSDADEDWLGYTDDEEDEPSDYPDNPESEDVDDEDDAYFNWDY